jgi:Right handed beta helix region
MRTAMTAVTLGALLAGALLTSPAEAQQRERDFVASYGSDSNPCSFTQPCRTFQAAVNAVLAGGEITAIDSAGFGAIVINKAVTITSPAGVEASIAPIANSTAIEIDAGPNDAVAIRGLTLEGAATGRSGVIFNSGGALEIQNCIIRNFTDTGVFVDPTTFMTLLIQDTLIADNPTAGITVQPPQPLAVTATFDRLTVVNNGYGIFLGGSPSNGYVIEATISNSTINASSTTGIVTMSSSSHGGEVFVGIHDVTISSGGFLGTAISASGPGTLVTISRVMAFNNSTGIVISGGAFVDTAGNNDLKGNATPVSGSLTAAPQQ